jgi:hypothetical protein
MQVLLVDNRRFHRCSLGIFRTCQLITPAESNLKPQNKSLCESQNNDLIISRASFVMGGLFPIRIFLRKRLIDYYIVFSPYPQSYPGSFQ